MELPGIDGCPARATREDLRPRTRRLRQSKGIGAIERTPMIGVARRLTAGPWLGAQRAREQGVKCWMPKREPRC